MLFSEIYGSYYNIVAEILKAAVSGDLSSTDINKIIMEKGFGETLLSIPSNLSDGTWPLLTKDLGTPITNAPSMPLTALQKRWMKSLLLDPRIQLFEPPVTGLEDIEPLFSPEDIVYYDRYADGDPYDDPQYIENFRVVLTALREKKKLRVKFKGHTGAKYCWICEPWKLEYSPKDDKFRFMTFSAKHVFTVNIGRLKSAKLLDEYDEDKINFHPVRRKELVLEVTDERNALERAMLHFSHLEKETEKLNEKTYKLSMKYEVEDETEILIRVLSFGPLVKVISPESFKSLIIQRLQKQTAFNN